MSYIQNFEAELTAKLASGTEDAAAIVKFASQKMLESYRNGMAAGRKRSAAGNAATPKAE